MKAAKDSLEILRARMQKAAEKEDYEEAARIKAQIDALSDRRIKLKNYSKIIDFSKNLL